MASGSAPETIGKYRISGPLGRGSMGVVYKATDPEIGRPVAIKTMRRMTEQNIKLHGADTALERFRNEARSAGILRHPNIITIFEVNIQGDLPYIVMDYVEGESLYGLLTRHGRLAPALVISYLAQIASAIDYAHRKGVLHRDLKPSNIMVDRNDTVFVLDFGVASINRSYSDWETPLTRNPVVGTPGYMSPEQILNESIDHRSDLYSLAVIAFECFTGQRPYPGIDPQELMRSTVQGKPASLSSIVPALPLALEAEVERALSRQRFERFDSATEMVSAFSKALGIEIVTAVPTNASGRVVLRDSAAVQRVADVTPPVRPDSGEHTLLAPLPNTMLPAERGGGGSGREVLPPMWDSPKYPSASSKAAARGVDSPGQMFRRLEPPSGGIPMAKVQRTELFKRLTVALFIVGFLLSGAIIWYALDEMLGPKDHVVDPAVGVLSGIVAAPNNIAFGSLVDPPSDPVPPGKEVPQMSDRELIGVLKSLASPEILVIEALKEAFRRRIALLPDAVVYPLRSDSYVVRVEALKILADLKDRRVLPQVLLRLEDHDPVVRGFAARAIGELGDGTSVSYLQARLLREEDPTVRKALEKALERITGIAPAFK